MAGLSLMSLMAPFPLPNETFASLVLMEPSEEEKVKGFFGIL